MFQAQVLGTVLGAITNYYVLVIVIDQKRPFLDGTEVDRQSSLLTPLLSLGQTQRELKYCPFDQPPDNGRGE